MNYQETIQAAEEAATRINNGESPEALVHFVEQGDEFYLSTPLPPGSNLSGLTERYYTLGYLAEQGLLALKDEALVSYADTLDFEGNWQVKSWLHSDESHLVAEALINLSWGYAHYQAVSLCRKPRSQW